MNHQICNILKLIKSRSLANITCGGDGYISSKNLAFDVGLNSKTVHRELKKLVTAGLLEHKQDRPRQPHFYRCITQVG